MTSQVEFWPVFVYDGLWEFEYPISHIYYETYTIR